MTDSPEGVEAAENSVIDESLIMKLLRAFYAKVRVDPLIGPIFNARIQDWEHHLVRIGECTCRCPSMRHTSIAGSGCLRKRPARCVPRPLRNNSSSAPAPSAGAWKWASQQQTASCCRSASVTSANRPEFVPCGHAHNQSVSQSSQKSR